MRLRMMIVPIKKHLLERLLVKLVCGTLLLALATTISCDKQSAADQLDESSTTTTNDEALEGFRVVQEANGALDDSQLSGIVKNFGEHLKDTMDEEMDRLIKGMESDATSSNIHTYELESLRKANEAAGNDIRARVELTGDNGGALPQAGLGDMASSFVSVTSKRLEAAGSYIGNKISSLGDNVKRKIPSKLRRFFKWPTFLSFKIKFHKVYKSLPEELYRQMVFLHSHVKVGMQHIRYKLGRDRHLNGQNEFSDMTSKEFKEQLNNPIGVEDDNGAPKLDSLAEKKLEQLAQEGKNVFGVQVPAGKPIRRQKRQSKRSDEESDAEQQLQSKRQRRERRNVDTNGLDSDNEEWFELEDYEDELKFHDASDELMSDTEDDDAEKSFKTVEEFASQLVELDEDLDDALGARDTITPVDLRDTGCVLEPENQAGCGCCYAHAISTLASYYNCMDEAGDEGQTRTPTRYHVRFVSDCGRYLWPENERPFINGCRGGRMSQAYEFIRIVGVLRHAEYNIDQFLNNVHATDQCAYKRPESIVDHKWGVNIVRVPMFMKSRYTKLEHSQIELHLRTIGPVTVNIKTWRGYKEYQAGILDDLERDENEILHSIVVVGIQNDQLGKPYYIVRNSHGISWGENGFFKISRDMLVKFAVSYGGSVPNFSDE